MPYYILIGGLVSGVVTGICHILYCRTSELLVRRGTVRFQTIICVVSYCEYHTLQPVGNQQHFPSSLNQLESLLTNPLPPNHGKCILNCLPCYVSEDIKAVDVRGREVVPIGLD